MAASWAGNLVLGDVTKAGPSLTKTSRALTQQCENRVHAGRSGQTGDQGVLRDPAKTNATLAVLAAASIYPSVSNKGKQLRCMCVLT